MTHSYGPGPGAPSTLQSSAHRWAGGVLSGLVVATALTTFCGHLIEVDDAAIPGPAPGLDLGWLDKFEETEPKKKIRTPVPPKLTPPLPTLATTSVAPTVAPDLPSFDAGPGPGAAVAAVDAGPVTFRPGDGEVVPDFLIDPQYPRAALLEGTEGFVTVVFTVRPDGTVADVEVVEAEPARVFDRAAVRAVYRWRYRPATVDGRPAERRVQHTILFRLDDR